ncbi:hypothetical protein Q7O44_14450 [Shigella flexneri]|nr:hypothetical protein [Shigella flexneri]
MRLKALPLAFNLAISLQSALWVMRAAANIWILPKRLPGQNPSLSAPLSLMDMVAISVPSPA